MRRALVSAMTALVLIGVGAAVAHAHSAFLASDPEPGIRLVQSPSEVALTFTEPVNERLSRAELVGTDGRTVADVASYAAAKRLTLRIARHLGRGAYRVHWHTVSTEDGHVLEGSFAFGVRAAPASAAHDVQRSPLARYGWLRALVRVLMDATALMFCGALLLDVLLRRRGQSWLTPSALRDDALGLDHRQVERRAQRLVLDVGLLAAAAAGLSAVVDAADAAGGLSARGFSDYLLGGSAGLTRLYVVALLLAAGALANLRSRFAVVPALGALAALSLSGHANAASPRAVAVVNDWLHLATTAIWVGGIALIVLVWWPVLRRREMSTRIAVARDVLPQFGRAALPAFLLVVLTGLVSAAIELGRLPALWETDYRRVLMVKALLVATIAATSFLHALRLRPRLVGADPQPGARLERRHWQLLRTEPLLGLGVVVVAALLVAFPLPPRQLNDADDATALAPAAVCDPCPLPSPAKDELAVAERGGSDVAAAWMRRDGASLAGTVRLYGLDARPTRDPFTIVGAQQSPCGTGCARFRMPDARDIVAVRVVQQGRRYVARLPTRWEGGETSRARRLLARAQRTMRALGSAREVERVSSVPGITAQTVYRVSAPDRMSYRTSSQAASVVIGSTQWSRGQPRAGWERSEYGGGLPFRARSWFTWTNYARHAYLLDAGGAARRRVAVIALMDPGTPAWWRLEIDLHTGRVLRTRLVTYGHFMTQRFSAFNRPMRIRPPRGTRDGG